MWVDGALMLHFACGFHVDDAIFDVLKSLYWEGLMIPSYGRQKRVLFFTYAL